MILARAPLPALLAGLSGALTLSYSPLAGAFCRTTTCDPATECDYDGRGCATVGEPLAWKRSCVSYSVQKDGSPKRNISYSRAHELTEEAFERWTEPNCDGERPSLNAVDASPVSCSEPEYNSGDPNANVIMFRDVDWPYAGANATLALTTITFNFQTGEIFDADIEVNSFKTPLTTSDIAVEFDLASILTHEIGHFLGLSHSHVEDSTMFLEYRPGDKTLRELDADDVAGICAAYPPDRRTTSNDCEPRHGFSGDCRRPPDDGCSFRAVPNPDNAWFALWPTGIALSAACIRRARRQRRTRRAR